MLFAPTGLMGCPVDGTDGRLGAVKDFLFDDRSWKVRWMVLDTGHWLPGRRILIHPSAIAPLEVPPKPSLPMMSMGQTLTVSVNLSRQQVEASPDMREDEPCTKQLEGRLYEHYGWDPYWADTYFRPAEVDPVWEAPIFNKATERLAADKDPRPDDVDPHLHSVAEVKGYHVHATDGEMGHVENFLADDVSWDIRYFVIATRNWLLGKDVQIAPFAVTEIDSAGRQVKLNVTREQVQSASAWDPLTMADEVAEQAYHRHFGWPGYSGKGT
jgi:hypothetical protein